MSDELNEQPEALTQDEGQAQEPELDIEDLKAKAAKADEYKGFAERVSNENKELKKKLSPQDLITNKSSTDSDERFERLELQVKGYKDDEVDFLMRNGGKQALNDKLVISAIESQRKAAKSTEATPSGTGKSTVYQKFTEQDLKRMSYEELEKIVPQ